MSVLADCCGMPLGECHCGDDNWICPDPVLEPGKFVKAEPKFGDQRPIAPCTLCGGEQFEIWLGKDEQDAAWTPVMHLHSLTPTQGPSYYTCLKETLRRVAALETALSELKEKVNL